jgi:uncharacterized protein with HEPN domain
MLSEKQHGLLRDILDSATVIRTYLADVSQADFMANSEKQDAVLRRFEIIGEASSRLAPETQAPFLASPSARCAACGTSLLMTMAMWISTKSGVPPQAAT